VATDVLGVSGCAMIEAMIEGESDPQILASYAKGRLKARHEELVESLEGCLTEHHRWMLRELWEQLEQLEQDILHYDDQLRLKMSGYERQLELLDTIGGVGRRSAENILAEIGPEMSYFPSDNDLVSWGGLCPGHNESAGKQRSGKTPKGNRWLRRALMEPVWSATREKEGYLAALYRRLAPRRGKKRAAVAVARTILVAAWHILKEDVAYKDLGGDYFDRRNEERTRSTLVKRLEKLGYEVELKQKQASA
jgi:transposase